MTATYQPKTPIWCAGCGHFGVQGAISQALRELAIPSATTIILAGIGCSGTVQNNLGTYGFHALHGRVLPTATGTALADPSLTVIAAGGDGDGYAIGAGHLVHAFRRNPSLTYVVMNNSIYGLTKGQDSPTAPLAFDPRSPGALDAILLGLSIRSTTFLARGFTRRPEQLVELTVAALEHARSGSGFAFLEVLSPCVTYQDTYPSWDAAVVDLADDAAHDSSDRAGAFRVCMGLLEEGRIPTGIVYRGSAESMVPDPAPAGLALDDAQDRLQEIMGSYAV